MLKRGIISTLGTSLVSPQGIFFQNPNPVLLRQYALYWDQIDWPHNGVFEPQLYAADTDVLASANVLVRTQVPKPTSIHIGFAVSNEGGGFLQSKEGLEAVLGAEAFAFQRNRQRSDEEWAIGQSSNQFQVAQSFAETGHVLEVELYDCLPVPTSETQIEDILDFKGRRKSELLALRHQLDDMYRELRNVNDPQRLLDKYQAQITASISVVEQLFAESRISAVRRSIKGMLELDISDGIRALGIGVVADVVLGLPGIATTCGAANLVLGGIKTSVDLTAKPRDIPDSHKPFAFLAHAKDELKIEKPSA